MHIKKGQSFVIPRLFDTFIHLMITAMKRNLFLFVMMFVFMGYISLSAQTVNSVTFTVTNVPTPAGKVLLSDADGKYYGMADATGDSITICISNIPDGKYRFYVFHDANGNMKMDLENNIPTEYCATQDVEINTDTRTFVVSLENIKEKVTGK